MSLGQKKSNTEHWFTGIHVVWPRMTHQKVQGHQYFKTGMGVTGLAHFHKAAGQNSMLTRVIFPSG